MLDDAKLIYVCAACSHPIEAAEQPCQCPKCRIVGKARDFPTEPSRQEASPASAGSFNPENALLPK